VESVCHSKFQDSVVSISPHFFSKHKVSYLVLEQFCVLSENITAEVAALQFRWLSSSQLSSDTHFDVISFELCV
jgi:hypothetical protein